MQRIVVADEKQKIPVQHPAALLYDGIILCEKPDYIEVALTKDYWKKRQ